jgi:predicted TIM-barrel fold metal-dependent hydrolase
MRVISTHVLKLFPLFLMCMACSRNPADLYQRIPKIDAHVHIRTENPLVMEVAMAEGFKLLTINTRSSSQDYIDRQMEIARAVKSKYPDRLSYITTFSMEHFEDPSWGAEVIRTLERDFSQGAVGLKVWKDIGMTFHDSLGNFIFIDDPLFDPIFDYVAHQGKTVIAHIGEPRNCWLPIDSMTVNNDKLYFSEHPEYHMYLHPDYPSYEKLVQSRDNLLAKHPDLRLVGAHLGSLEWDVDELAARLDRFPNFAVDMAARVCHLQVQDRDKVREFIIKYQDRLLYATDLVVSDENVQQQMTRIEKEWKADWKYFATGETMESPNVDGTFVGLGLNPDILKKIYHDNALKWYPGLFE